MNIDSQPQSELINKKLGIKFSYGEKLVGAPNNLMGPWGSPKDWENAAKGEIFNKERVVGVETGETGVYVFENSDLGYKRHVFVEETQKRGLRITREVYLSDETEKVLSLDDESDLKSKLGIFFQSIREGDREVLRINTGNSVRSFNPEEYARIDDATEGLNALFVQAGLGAVVIKSREKRQNQSKKYEDFVAQYLHMRKLAKLMPTLPKEVAEYLKINICPVYGVISKFELDGTAKSQELIMAKVPGVQIDPADEVDLVLAKAGRGDAGTIPGLKLVNFPELKKLDPWSVWIKDSDTVISMKTIVESLQRFRSGHEDLADYFGDFSGRNILWERIDGKLVLNIIDQYPHFKL